MIGRVDKTARNATRFRLDEAVGVSWIHSSGGAEHENIDAAFSATGRDFNDGYAGYIALAEACACPVADIFSGAGAAPVVESLANPRPGGRLVINAVRKKDGDRDYLRQLKYHEHLWMEKEIESAANAVHNGIAEFLPIAAAIPLQPGVQT